MATVRKQRVDKTAQAAVDIAAASDLAELKTAVLVLVEATQRLDTETEKKARETSAR
jgi:hypothetical protein